MAVMTSAGVTPGPDVGSHRRRIIAAAVEMTARTGWSGVTMGRIADAVGVSRQTAMVLEELTGFLAVVDAAFDHHPGDAVESIREATLGVLELARDNTLLRTIVSTTHGGESDLLPLLTTRAESLIMTATNVIAGRLEAFDLPLTRRQLDAGIDVVVRVVLSHVMQPSGTPRRTADDVAWIAGRVLGAD